MALQMPTPIAAYFSAQAANDSAALARNFAPDAIVHDEGGDIRGSAAIEAWMQASKRKYQHTSEPLSVAERDGKVVVAAKVSGNFPNSPVTLEHVFELADGKIISLAIH